MLISHLFTFFGGMSVKIFGSVFNMVIFFFLFLHFKYSLCILDNSPLSNVSFSNIFFQSVKRFLILIKSSLSIISFMDHIFCIVFKKISSYPRSSSFSPMLFSRIFILTNSFYVLP
uniref:Uncharacterized protein n=1 Tax=Sus scrofa TaxID=9823 RepID=A0A4X1SMT2_PIG